MKEQELLLQSLYRGLVTSFEWIGKRLRAGSLLNIADDWAALVASALDGVRLSARTLADPAQADLPFADAPIVHTDLFVVGNSGVGGGPNIDVLFQLWIETEMFSACTGVPMIMRSVPAKGALPPAVWDEIRSDVIALGVFTPVTRVVLFGEDADFEPASSYGSEYSAMVLDTFTISGLKRAPRGREGQPFIYLCHDLASGRHCDPSLSGRTETDFYRSLIRTCNVRRILRLRVEALAANTRRQ